MASDRAIVRVRVDDRCRGRLGQGRTYVGRKPGSECMFSLFFKVTSHFRARI